MSPLRILIIDDDPDDAALASKVLSAEPGCEARSIGSATEFVEALQRGEFDAVVTEAKLPWIDGLEIVRSVHKAAPGKAVVLFTRASSDTLFSAALAAGVDGFAAKSSRGFTSLAETIRGACDRAATRVRRDDTPFRLLIEKTTTALIFQCSLDGKLIESSGPYSSLAGLNPADQGSANFLERILPADRREAALERLQKHGVVRLSDVPLGRPGTKEVRCTLRMVLTKEAQGQSIFTGTLDVSASAAAPAGPKSMVPPPRSAGPASVVPGARRLQAVETSLPPAMATMAPGPKREETPALAQRALMAAHDLKEPLRTLVHYSDLLRSRYRGQLDADADEYLGFVHEASLRMRSQVARLFTEASEVSGGAGRTADTLAVLDRVVTYLRASINATKASVTHGTLPTLPIGEEDLVQILQNLVGNALKFHGEAPPKVHVDVSRTGSEWMVSVEDNGIGIAPEDMSRLFSMFERGRRSPGVPGTGIGLALCKNIAERNGGRIWASRNVSGGTTFFFTLPVAAEGSGAQENVSRISSLRPKR